MSSSSVRSYAKEIDTTTEVHSARKSTQLTVLRFIKGEAAAHELPEDVNALKELIDIRNTVARSVAHKKKSA